MRFAASHYLGIGSAKPITVTTTGGSRVTLPVYALSAVFEVFGANLYNLPGDFGPAPVAVDIGGHVGTFTVALCEAYPAARCFSFEPAPDTFSFLDNNVRQNGLSQRVQTAMCAVGGHAGTATMDVAGPAASGHRSILSSPPGSAATVDVPVRAFADVVRAVGEPIDIMKMDCEGSEYPIVEETSAADWRDIRRVVMEYHPGSYDRLVALAQRMRSFGFTLVGQWRWQHSDDLLGMLWWAKPGYESGFSAATAGKGADHLDPVAIALPTAGPGVAAAA